jgi:hypothetical protein
LQIGQAASLDVGRKFFEKPDPIFSIEKAKKT